MRLRGEYLARLSVLGLALALSGCGVLGGGDRPVAAVKEVPQGTGGGASQSPALIANGPAADYPIVLGEPFTIDGLEYVPADTLNYDEVGYATLDAEGGVSASHKTLPLPSYVEVTSLETGRTILVRIERRGPMTGARLIGLSAGAQAQLGSKEGTAVRVRRVNPPEVERAALRAGQPAPERLETPMSLVEVLKRKLPEAGSVSLAREEATPETPQSSEADEQEVRIAVEIPDEAPEPKAATEDKPALATAEVRAPKAEGKKPSSEAGDIVIRAATFSSETNAKRAAAALEGFIVPAGRFFRVHTGPYTSRGQANAALAKVKAAGYSDARVINAG